MNFLFLEIDVAWLQKNYFGETVASYAWFVGIIIATLLFKKKFAVLISRLSSRLSTHFSYAQHKDALSEMLYKPMERVVQIVLYDIAINQLSNLQEHIILYHFKGKKGVVTLSDAVDHIFLFLFIIFICHFIGRFIDFIFYIRIHIAQEEKNNNQMQLFPLLKEMSKLGTWTLATFWILGSVFNVNIPALITGLGIGGVAIALAGKETVENIFAAFTLLSDKPFQTTDVIKIGETEGLVERIGFRSTRIRNYDGSITIIPNQRLVGQNVINLSARDRHGIKFIAQIKYGITAATLNLITEALKQELPKLSPVQGNIEVNLKSLEKETFQLVVIYSLPHPLPVQQTLLQIKHTVNSKIFEIISRHAALGTPIGTS